MKKEYKKLVRDRIPEIIREAGRDCEIETLSETQYRLALRDKLIEEAQEVRGALNQEDLIKELADLSEVIEAIIQESGISKEVVLAEQKKRRTERGGFENRTQLIWVD
ncbi:nucleoside triphosphate pyrophosphohydrolase [Ancylothrix sp. C2]|uniref:nucleoside triphosphate pyrophosphohydrolase n=1 Tax=Ancylothrix sp. D3o TaxID=2953691 RepID=UPI0021BB3311|nr:nucleoside triphosphate pyrophosphohydrolase [Ancylothrix sp. D3o]MCT7951185.1 nucleoside triphosphate pyrophosphohydrolase [Ancylothrix sp. D3o]